MLLIATLNLVGRYVINILAEPIRNELGLFDSQIGLVTGLAFALFFTFAGIPIARLADRGNRPMIISASIVVWSAFTALSGFAQNFMHLFLARIGVGAGEAGCTPPSHSLITDYAPVEKRAAALAVFQMGAPLGSMIGLAVGGIIADAFGWRMAFLVCAIPGILVGLVAALTLAEPRERVMAASAHPTPPNAQISMPATLAILSAKPTFWPLTLGITTTAFISYGHGPFTASFFFRNHAHEVAALAAGMGLKAGGFLGTTLGLIAGIGGVAGAWIGGWLCDKRGLIDKRAYLNIPAMGTLASLPLYIGALLFPSVPWAIALLFMYQIISGLQSGPIFATAMSIAPREMRATASSIILLVISLLGLGLGPLLVGAISDLIAISLNRGTGEGIRWALIIGTLPAFFAYAMYRKAGRTMLDDIEG